MAQALTLLNDALVTDCAAALAQRVCAARDAGDTESRVHALFERVLSRPPSAEETRWCLALAEREGVRRLLAGAELDAAREAGIAHVAHTLFNTSEFLSLP